MRAATRICGIVNHLADRPPFEYPSHTTVRNFLLRVGLYLLQNVRRHGDWIWIVDHTFSVGTLKVLVVLGIRLPDYLSLGRPLEYRDLTVLAMLTVESSNGSVVQKQFNDLAGKTGEPLAILSDAGSDLNKGTKLFQTVHQGVISLYDIVHLTSRKIEKIMKADSRWDAFRQACCQCANAVRQSKLAHLKPPKPRTKARYMNIDREIRWAARALWILDRVRSGQLTDRQKQRLPQEDVEAKFGWLDEYRDSIKGWERLSLTGQQVIREVRRHGYGDTTVAAVNQIAEATDDATSQELTSEVIALIKPMCQAARLHGRLPSSSEILESLFGKGKHLLSGGGSGGGGTTNSLTGLLLALVGCTTTITPSLVRDAFSSVSITDVHQWVSNHFGQALHYVRRLDLTPTPEEQTLRKPIPPAIPNF